jgi:hypothetical protein
MTICLCIYSSPRKNVQQPFEVADDLAIGLLRKLAATSKGCCTVIRDSARMKLQWMCETTAIVFDPGGSGQGLRIADCGLRI